jgi:hypothetical protein
MLALLKQIGLPIIKPCKVAWFSFGKTEINWQDNQFSASKWRNGLTSQ